MAYKRLRLIALVVCSLLAACGGSPTASSGSYTGQWAGTILASGGASVPFSFVVSSSQRVTSITFGLCSGFSLTSLDVPIQVYQAGTLNSYTGFIWAGTADQPGMQIIGSFTDTSTASGDVVITGTPGCGTGTSHWNAQRR